jgi:hypothetical protein
MSTRPQALRPKAALLAAVFGLPCLPATLPLTLENGLNLEEITTRLAESEHRKRVDVQDFTVTRRYRLRNSHLAKEASIVVKLTYDKERGKSFQILQTENADGLGLRVLERVLEGEVQASRLGKNDEAALTPENYDFDLLGTDLLEGRRCYVLGLRPKARSRYLLSGKAWIDADEFAAVKIVGRPSANLSFWVGKPEITQHFQKYGEFWLASYNHSLAESRLLGKSELTIEFSNYDVHGVPNEARIMGVTPRANVASHGSLYH